MLKVLWMLWCWVRFKFRGPAMDYMAVAELRNLSLQRRFDMEMAAFDFEMACCCLPRLKLLTAASAAPIMPDPIMPMRVDYYMDRRGAVIRQHVLAGSVARDVDLGTHRTIKWSPETGGRVFAFT